MSILLSSLKNLLKRETGSEITQLQTGFIYFAEKN